MKEQPKSREEKVNNLLDVVELYTAGHSPEAILKNFSISRVSCEPPKPDYVPYQLCPKCLGDGHLGRYNSPIVMSTSCIPMCDVCNGSKVIPMISLEKVSGEANTKLPYRYEETIYDIIDTNESVAAKASKIITLIKQITNVE